MLLFLGEEERSHSAEHARFFGISIGEVQEDVLRGSQAPGQCVYTQRARSPRTHIGSHESRPSTSWIGLGILDL